MRRIVVVLLLWSSGHTCLAGVLPYVCETYVGSESHLPNYVKEIQTLAHNAAVKTCTTSGDSGTTYSVLRKVESMPGVCDYAEGQVFRDVSHWTLTPPPGKYNGPPVHLMLVHDSGCPSPEDPRYVRVVNVSEDIFLNFERFWKRVASSQTAFDASLRQIPARTKQTDFFRKLETAISGTDDQSGVKIESLAFFEALGKEPAHYESRIATRDHRWKLDLDLVGNEFQITNLYGLIE